MSQLSATSLPRSRGMRDLLPSDMRGFRRVEDAFRAAATRWGYEEVRTPTIETYRLFTAAGALTPQMLSRVYSFLDWDGWSGERVVLRPDSTIPVARLAAGGELDLPARLFYVQNVFRFSEDGDREDWQCGIEYLEAPGSLGEVEVAAVACETLEALGLSAEVRLGHVGIARAAVAAAGGLVNGAAPAMLADSARSGLAALRPLAGSNPALGAFLDVALQPAGPALIANLKALARVGLPTAIEALDDLEQLAAALTASGRTVEIALGMPRDFEYYSGVVFEFSSGGRAWGGGGRYAPAGGDGVSTACGLGLEAASLASHLRESTRRQLVVTIIPAERSDLGRAVAVARALHRSGIAATLGNPARLAELAVAVAGGRLVARTPDGERVMTSLDDVVELLVRYK